VLEGMIETRLNHKSSNVFYLLSRIWFSGSLGVLGCL